MSFFIDCKRDLLMAAGALFIALGDQRFAIGLVLFDRAFLLIAVFLQRLKPVFLDSLVSKVHGRLGQCLLLAFARLA
ncbi:hypothetical protein [Candidatus Accumulibacter contiguus]|uniref:hypothetical protein n=1 Tax=Candidatus Accumulibacter contiguus TaxID=2954381 RepID=UPI001B7E4898|nr:hypothetical protein [Candidatus Accumulibacter contiguus]